MTSGQGGIGCEDGVCPYCGVLLDNMPGRKKKCPACGEFIYVRTRPSDRVRVLVTEAQAEEIKAQWSAYHRQVELSHWDEPGLTADQQWAKCNSDQMAHAMSGNWGLFRNTRLHMANILHREGRLKAALTTYLDVCYLDVNGANNVGGIWDYALLCEFPPFNPKLAFLAPAVIDWVLEVSRDLGMDSIGLRDSFLEMAMPIQARLHLPIPPSEAWQQIAVAAQRSDVGQTVKNPVLPHGVSRGH